jgi:hypothetical protein
MKGSTAFFPLAGTPRVRTRRGVAHQIGRARTRIAPELLPGESVKDEHLVRPGNVHVALSRQRSWFQAEVRNREDPLEAQSGYIGRIDLGRFAPRLTL